ncbi:MAG: enoyl-CoA hydratase-related protein [Planctomycetota bacterium]
MSDVVTYANESGVGVVTMRRPKVNAYDEAFHVALLDAIQQAEADTPAVVVLRSGIDGIFCVGADIKAWAANSAEGNAATVRAARASANALAGSTKLVIAHVAGHALGGGLELMLACDLVVAQPGDYQLGLPEIKLGLMPGNGGVARLVGRVGRSRALLLTSTGRSITPSEAHGIGLVDDLCDADAFDEQLNTFAAGPREAIAAIKRTVASAESLSLSQALAFEAEQADTLAATPDAVEGAAAFAEKRSPVFARDRRVG